MELAMLPNRHVARASAQPDLCMSCLRIIEISSPTLSMHSADALADLELSYCLTWRSYC